MSNTIKNTLIAVTFLTVGIFAGVYGKGLITKLAGNEVATYQPSEGETIAAVVDGYNIYKEDVMVLVKNLGISRPADIEKLYPVVVNQMVTDRLVDAEVAKSGITDSKDYKKKIEETNKQIAKSMFFEKVIKGNITEKELKSEYETIKSKNEGVKEAKARHILVKTEAEAKQVIKDLDKGKKFAKLAKERSIDATAKRGGDLGYFSENGEIVPEFAKATFALKKGEYTKKPVKTPLGWHVIKLENKRNRKVPSFDEMKASIQNGLVQKMVMESVKTLRKNAKVEMFNFHGNSIPEVNKTDMPATK